MPGTFFFLTQRSSVNPNLSSLRCGAGQAQRRAAGACVVVTGAAGGIGAAVVARLRRDGWRVLACDSDGAGLAHLPAAVSAVLSDASSPVSASVSAGASAGDRAADGVAPGPSRDSGQAPGLQCCTMDVTCRADIDRVVAKLQHTGWAVAGLVNVAGVLQDVGPLLGRDEGVQRRVWEVNYFGAEQCIQAFAPTMVAGGGGAIVNITSINQHRPLRLHAYAPSKVALGTLTELAAAELGPMGVRVNAVAPGFTLTPIFRDKLASGKRDPAAIEAHTAMGRLVETDEVAAAVGFLMGDESSAITGVSLPVDCGWLASSHWMNFRDLG